jgi:hypothetical protein
MNAGANHTGVRDELAGTAGLPLAYNKTIFENWGWLLTPAATAVLVPSAVVWSVPIVE